MKYFYPEIVLYDESTNFVVFYKQSNSSWKKKQSAASWAVVLPI